jgi:hypothetical protein
VRTLTARELAALVLQVLEAQKKYFKSRDQADLIASKQMESRLKKAAQQIMEAQLGF